MDPFIDYIFGHTTLFSHFENMQYSRLCFKHLVNIVRVVVDWYFRLTNDKKFSLTFSWWFVFYHIRKKLHMFQPANWRSAPFSLRPAGASLSHFRLPNVLLTIMMICPYPVYLTCALAICAVLSPASRSMDRRSACALCSFFSASGSPPWEWR